MDDYEILIFMIGNEYMFLCNLENPLLKGQLKQHIILNIKQSSKLIQLKIQSGK